MLTFRLPAHDPSAMEKNDLGNVGGLVQSMRWFNGRASQLAYAWGMLGVLEVEKASQTSPLTSDVVFTLERLARHSVVLDVRALHDYDTSSLGAGQIAKQLADTEAREGLHDYLSKYPHGRMNPDRGDRDRYLDYVQKWCRVSCEKVTSPKFRDHPLSAKTQLVRLKANRLVAHSTLHDWMLARQDLADTVIASMVIAYAIDAAVGDAATGNDFGVCEVAGFRAARVLLRLEGDEPPPEHIGMLSKFVPRWVEGGADGPLYPDWFVDWCAGTPAGFIGGNFKEGDQHRSSTSSPTDADG